MDTQTRERLEHLEAQVAGLVGTIEDLAAAILSPHEATGDDTGTDVPTDPPAPDRSAQDAPSGHVGVDLDALPSGHVGVFRKGGGWFGIVNPHGVAGDLLPPQVQGRGALLDTLGDIPHVEVPA